MSDGDDHIGSLIDEALAALIGGKRQRHRFHHAVDDLVDLDGLDGPGRHRPERVAGRRLAAAVDGRWERGWEPADLAHVVRRENDPRLGRLAAAVIGATLAEPGRRALLPPRWRAQCVALGVDVGAPVDPVAGAAAGGASDDDGAAGPEEVVVGWRRAERLDVGTALEAALQLLARLNRLPDLDPLGLPPSQWTVLPAGVGPHSGLADDGPDEPADPKLLTTIRALLAKAESTPFPAEADAFAAKAQSLMTAHAVDAAALAAAAAASPRGLNGAVRMRRFPIDDPYGTEKAGLLGVVADLNDVRVVWDSRLGLATLVGFPSDLDLVELLVTSLLIQATRAVNDPANAAPDRRAPAFRRAFLLAYADRIADRLERAQRGARRAATAEHGAAPVPVLAARREAVDAVTDRLFPGTSSSGPRLVDARGWEAGRQAADQARLQP